MAHGRRRNRQPPAHASAMQMPAPAEPGLIPAAVIARAKTPCSRNRDCGRPALYDSGLHARDVLLRELILPLLRAGTTHRLRHHGFGVVFRQGFHLRPLGHGPKQTPSMAQLTMFIWKPVILLKFRQPCDDLQYFGFALSASLGLLRRITQHSRPSCVRNDLANSAPHHGHPMYFHQCSPLPCFSFPHQRNVV